MKYKVSIIDDHALFRRGVAELLQQSENFQLLSQHPSGAVFLKEIPPYYPDLLLLDLQMPNESGLDILQQIRIDNQTLKIVMLTASDDDHQIIEALRQGANGYLSKDTAPDEILHQLHEVVSGQTALNQHGINVLAQQLRQQPVIKTASDLDQNFTYAKHGHLDILQKITQREKETLLLIAKGLNNKLIARQLGISDGTVKVYVKNLLRKLNVHSRLELSVWTHQHLNLDQ
ncbi:response regulator [Acinetobacter qingfengensis]|uniref:DNA-binding response regulator n=1 Tax=Acinetobacter qingfengensis TaxID=1262585 RepID=A0A1E7RC77_9GAMM|nr:response regulator [Acinetobacter qingfengensis]KAA8735261.1 response regulator [Acinetobacter qingfengensis]OEY96964.1 DNA-binding response regulator [Acinetobacter qingfengensis]